MMKTWCDLAPGQAIDGGYVVESVDERGLWLRRPSGSRVRVTRAKIARVRRRLLDGDLLERQEPECSGGISYTVAIVKGVEAALRDVLIFDDVLGVFRRRCA
ncbi:MAG: hypothetical protein KF878_09735 [Planctomycetes bacterium]|nr:hypothetical protein [Planctomycetota bacterium]